MHTLVTKVRGQYLIASYMPTLRSSDDLDHVARQAIGVSNAVVSATRLFLQTARPVVITVNHGMAKRNVLLH